MKVADLAQILLKPSDSYTYQETETRYDVGASRRPSPSLSTSHVYPL